MADTASLVVRVSSTGVDSTSKSLDGLTASSAKADRASQSLTASADKAAKGIPRVGSVAQQAGYQIQDMVNVLQSGQSAFVAIGQQVPQFLGAFGPIGAITGTVVALSSALLGVAYSASQAEQDVTALVAAGQRLANLNLDSLVEANDISREFTSPERVAQYKALSSEVINLSQQYENQALATKRLREEVQAAQENMQNVGGFFGDSQAEATERLQQKQSEYNESLRKEAEIRSQVNALREKQNALGDEESKQKSEAEKAPARQQKVDDRAARQAEIEAKRLDIQRSSAEQYIERLRQSNLTEIQLVDAQEKEKLAKVAEYRANALITEQQHQAAINEIHKTATQERIDIQTKEIDDYYSQMADSRKADIAARKEEESARQKTIDDGIDAQRNMTNDLKSVLGEQNEIYRTSAIIAATIDTYKAATGAYAALSSVPFVGPYIAPVAAGLAITAGLANVAAIAGAREQGGGMRGGSAYQMAERGKAEVIVPAGNSRAHTAEQMRSIMGQNGGSQIQGVTIVNNTTGRVDSATTEVDNEGMLRVIIDEHVSAALMMQDSPIAKARRQTAGQPGY